MRHVVDSCSGLCAVRWRGLTKWLGDVRRGSASPRPDLPAGEAFAPLEQEVARLATSLNAARAAAEEEARLRDAGESQWTAERLRVSVVNKLGDSRLFAVSNREPYEHSHGGDGIECSVPASGLVTALEPVLRACNGTWIAQATGDADRETVDEYDRLARAAGSSAVHAAPRMADPGGGAGLLSRLRQRGTVAAVPHRAHAADLSRAGLGRLRAVNRRFADAVLEEIAARSVRWCWCRIIISRWCRA